MVPGPRPDGAAGRRPSPQEETPGPGRTRAAPRRQSYSVPNSGHARMCGPMPAAIVANPPVLRSINEDLATTPCTRDARGQKKRSPAGGWRGRMGGDLKFLTRGRTLARPPCDLVNPAGKD